MKRIRTIILMMALVVIGGPLMGANSMNFKLGLFYPNMNSDLWDVNMDNLALVKEDMQDVYFGFEYERFLNRNMSLAVEGGYYEKEHLSFYRDFEYDDGSPIYQNISLNMFSMEVDAKFYPMGHHRVFTLYFGGGAGLYYSKYEQWGDFIDFEEWVVDEDVYAESSGFNLGFNAKAGFVARFNPTWGLSFEGKYQSVKANMSSFFEGFEKLDLSGMVFTLGINVYFK